MKVIMINIKPYQSNQKIKKYLDEIKPYLKYIINNLKKTDTRKIQFTIGINFVSSKDNDKEHVMHWKSDHIEIMINNKSDEIIEKIFQSLLSRCETKLKTLKIQ